MLEAFRSRVVGAAATGLQRMVAKQVEVRIGRLLVDAALLWEQENFSRFNDGEIACTVRIYDCALRVIEAAPGVWPLVHIQYDGPQPTLAMRQGAENPAKATRPDLNVRMGSAIIHVEAKLLSMGNGLPKKYVTQGMMRFISKQYSTAQHNLGAMVAYVLHDDLKDVVVAVNSVVNTMAGMGPSHALDSAIWLANRVLSHESHHDENLRILHHLIDIRPSIAPTKSVTLQ